MKRLLVVVMAVLLLGLFVGGAFAQTGEGSAVDAWATKFAASKTAEVSGTVISHDVKCHCLVVKGPNGNVVVQDDYAEFNQEINRAKGLKVGGNAKVTYKTVDGINYATKIEQK
jgi:hypothetical protein